MHSVHVYLSCNKVSSLRKQGELNAQPFGHMQICVDQYLNVFRCYRICEKGDLNGVLM